MGLFSTPRATMATMGGLGLVLLLVVLSWARSPYGARWWDGLGGPRRGFGVVGPHFQPPDAALWGADAAAPYPTGAYWLNAALGSQPVPVAPYQVAALPQGFQLSYSARRRVATLEAQVDPFGVDWFGLPMGGGDGAADAAERGTALVVAQQEAGGGGYIAAGDALVGQGLLFNYTLERRSHLGATLQYGGALGVVLCKGSPLVAVEIAPAQAVFLAPGGAAGGRVESLEAKGGGLHNATLTDGSSWAIALLGDACDVASTSKGVAVAAGDGGCVARVGFLHADADWESVARAAKAYAVGGEPAFDPSKPGRYELRWDRRGDGDLYMLGAPHHAATLAGGAALLGPSGLVGAKGELAWVAGDVWVLEEDLPDVAIAYGGDPFRPRDAEAVVAQARRDVARLGASPSAPARPGSYGELYFEGKELGRLARLAVVCGDAGDDTCRDVAVANLERRFSAWLRRGDTVAVDPTWGGVVSRAGYPLKSGVKGATGQPFANYGNALYSDHHFQFGYFAYAAAVLAHFGRGDFVDAWRARLFELVFDFANPPAAYGGGDARFPRHGRHKDWYDGHSWATGLVAYATGKSQESSSESAHAYLAVALLGEATGDVSLRDWGRLCFATEVRGAKTYWQMGADSDVYAPAFAANRMAGSVAGTAAIATTWFGSNPEYVHGINLIPVLVGLTDVVMDEAYACDELPVLEAALDRKKPYPPVESSWRGFAYADLALVDPDEAWAKAATLDEAKFDDGATKANLLHWIASRRAAKAGGSCALATTNVTSLPWNASEVADVSCDGNLACFALGLSGFCCPQKDGYMFGCCPVLKAVPESLA